MVKGIYKDFRVICHFVLCIAFTGCIPEGIELPNIYSVTTADVTNITVDGATLNGSLGIMDTEKAVAFGVEYGTKSTSLSTNLTVDEITSAGDFSVNLTGLVANTTYYYRAYAVDAKQYRYGDVRTFTTCLSIATGDATNVTYSTATLGGTVNSGGHSVTCGIIYGTSSTLSSSKGTKKPTTSSGSYSVTISGLKAKTTYYYRAYAIVDGEYEYGEVRTFTTDLAITTGEATEVTYSAATLGGTVNSGGQSVTCGIIYGTSSKLSSTSGTLLSTTSSSEFSVRVMGLSSNTIYYYCAYVVVDGEYKYGEVLSFTTKTITIGDAIDLGLSVKWASWNVGADSPEGYGDYFAWGETEALSIYHNSNGITDDLSPSELESRGIIDADGNLTAAYDAATVNWGDEWRIPTLDEIQELLDRCSWSWTTQKGIYGRKIIGPNGNSIFLPAAGYHWGSSIASVGSYGGYWSATPNNDPVNAYYLNLKSGKSLGGRSIGGLTVRPVNAASKLNVSVTTGDATDISAVGATLGGIVSNSYKSLTCGIIYGTSSALSSTSGTMMSTTSSGEFSIEVTGLSPNTTYYYCSYVVVGDKYKYGDVRSFTTEAISITAGDAIDLGLSVKWASCNVGADSPEEYGDYYAWGETEEKNNYDWSTYKWGSNDYLTKYCFDPLYGVFDNKNYLEPEDDVAHVKRGDGWRMPTAGESFELAKKCIWLWISVNGVNGYLVTGPNGNSIFLPAAGYRYGTELRGEGTYGYYWTSSLYDMYPGYAWYHYGAADYYEYHLDHYISRVYGLTVRPVTDGKRNNSDVDLDGYPEDENWDARRRR